jgi:hypothetical protein
LINAGGHLDVARSTGTVAGESCRAGFDAARRPPEAGAREIFLATLWLHCPLKKPGNARQPGIHRDFAHRSKAKTNPNSVEVRTY